MILQAYEQFEAATVCYERARVFAAGDPRWIYYLGTTHAALRQWRAAAVSLRDFLKVETRYLPARLALARVLLELGELEESRRIYEQALADDRQVFDAHYGLGRALQAEGKLEKAAEQLRKTCEVFEQCGPARYALAVALRDKGDIAEAERHFAWYRRNPAAGSHVRDPLLAEVDALKTDALRRIQRGVTLEAAGKLEAAVTELQRALELEPGLVQGHINLISVYTKLGQPEKARQSYEDALAINPGQPDLHYNYGIALLEQQKFSPAAEAFKRTLEINPAHSEARTNLAQAFERLGNTREAMEQYRLAVDSQPNYRLALFHLARLLLDQQRNREALNLLLRTTAPEDEQTPVYLLATAKAYARLGYRPDSVQCAERAKHLALAFGQSDMVRLIEREMQRK
jgi:tetratricopeptide (TPR) repeat protein